MYNRIATFFIRYGNLLAVAISVLLGITENGKYILPLGLCTALCADMIGLTSFRKARRIADREVTLTKAETIRLLDNKIEYSFQYKTEYVVFSVEFDKMTEFIYYPPTTEYMFFGEIKMERSFDPEMKDKKTEYGPGFKFYNCFGEDFAKHLMVILPATVLNR